MAVAAAVLGPAALDFVARSPLVFLLSRAEGTPPDVSPRGDAPGFVRAIEGKKLLIPDRAGNNRLDTARNILSDPRIVLVFLCRDEPRVLEVVGTAALSADPVLAALFTINGNSPRSVMIIEVSHAVLRQAPAVVLAGMWSQARASVPFSLGAVLAQQIGKGAEVNETERLVAEDYRTGLY